MASKELNYNVGDFVVYPAHGVGQITGQETQIIGGMDVSVYVVSFEKEKMVLRVPVKRAEKVGLRALSTKADIEKALKTLKGRAKAGRGMWSRRAAEYEQKINSGNLAAIAEVVRDLHKNVDDPERSYSERMIYESALERLAGEYAVVKDVPAAKAQEVLVDALRKRKETVAEEEAAEAA
jgi:CarD family transcriptional regulator